MLHHLFFNANRLSQKKNKNLPFRLIPGNTGNNFGISGVTGERLDRMEEDLRRLTQGLDTLNGVVAGLEERLRTSLREDTNKILVSLLPNPPRVPDSTVGFGAIPDGTPDGLEGGESFAGFGDLAGRVTEVRDELRAKTHILQEIQVLYHNACTEISSYSVRADWSGFSYPSPSFVKCYLFSSHLCVLRGWSWAMMAS